MSAPRKSAKDAPVTFYAVPAAVAFQVLDVLRLAHIYVLKDSHPEELPPDFKPHKWSHEVEFANDSVEAYLALIEAMRASSERSGEARNQSGSGRGVR